MSKRSNGDGAVYFDNHKGKWIGQMTVGYDENGKRKRKTVYGKNPTEVKNKLKQVEFQIYTGDFVDKNSITIYQLAKQILDDKLNYNEIKETTYYTHMETLKRLKSIYNTPLQKVNETQLKSYLLEQQDYSQSIIDKDYQLLTMTFKEAVKRNIIAHNPMADVRKPKTKQKKEDVRAFTIQEQNKLLDLLQSEDIKYSNQMLLSMLTGMRMGEVNALKVSDINLIFNVIYVDKTISKGSKGEATLGKTTKTYAGTRQIPITKDVKSILQECIKYADGEMLFTTAAGKLITTNQVNMELKRALEKYDIVDKSVKGKVSCHSFRHTYATRCIEAGMQPKILQVLLGHTDINTTFKTYCSAFKEFQNDNIAKVNEYLQGLGLTIKSA